MAGKRQAISDINHTNWDREEDPEEPGQFREATEEELRKRVIKKARRRVTGENNDKSTPTNSIFSGFAGFAGANNITATKPKSSPFAFLSKLPQVATNPASTTSSSTTTTTTTASVPTFSFGSGNGNAKTDDKTKEIKINPIKATFSYESENKSAQDKKEIEAQGDGVYISKILKLNKSFCDWIVKHVNEQPLCNLEPTFRDYERFMREIRKEFKQEQDATKFITKKPILCEGFVTAATASSTASSTASVRPFFSRNFKFNSTSPTSAPSKTIGFGLSTAAASSSTTAVSTTAATTTTVTSRLDIVNSPKETEKIKDNTSSFSFTAKSAAEKTNGSFSATASPPSTSFSLSQTTKTNGDTKTEAFSKTPAPFTFGSPAAQSKSNTSKGFSFGGGDSKAVSSPPFSFGLKKNDTPPNSSGFSFTPGATPFTFANIKPPAVEPQKEKTADDDDEDEPPQVEIKEIVEEDAFYTKRCKVFVKKDNAYKDHGVGTFYLKPVKDSEKTQLLVRSSNNLGTILVNVILVEGMPTQLMGKNNVMLVHPGSSEDPKPQTTLFRVKDGTEADELLKIINKHKK